MSVALAIRDETTAPLPAGEGDLPRVTVAEKWQGAVMPGSGFAAIPMALLRLQKSLGLSATDLVVLVNLLGHWWEPERGVYPRSTTIARRMGVTKRTVQRSTQRLVQLGLIDRDYQDDGRRVFGFNPLAARLAHDLALSRAVQKQEGSDA